MSRSLAAAQIVSMGTVSEKRRRPSTLAPHFSRKAGSASAPFRGVHSSE
jgi:hypothetical protein